MGILGFGAAIFAGIAPLVATQLLNVVPSWHWVFVVVSVPGVIVAYLLHKTVKDPDYKSKEIKKDIPNPSLKEVFKYRNIKVGVFAMCGIMASLFVMGALLPNYLTDYLELSLAQMGIVATGSGLGSAIGAFAVPFASDKFGRKPTILAALIIATIIFYVFSGLGANLALLFITLFGASALVTGCLTTLDGPIATETVPPTLIGAATGIIIGIGEIFGGGVAPIISGGIAEVYGIDSVPYVAIVGLLFSFICCLFLKETAPEKIETSL